MNNLAASNQSNLLLPFSEATAPGKIILCGEHAVVYGRPAIALPLSDIRARSVVKFAQPGEGISFFAPDLGRSWALHAFPEDSLSQLVPEVLLAFGVSNPDIQITISSAIPIASGMGSGAAVATAIVRALAQAFHQTLSDAEISSLVYANERRLHGTPSGIDNAVVALEQAIWFQRGEPAPTIERLAIGSPLHIVIGDTGVRSATRLPVGAVREHWREQTRIYEALFDQVAAITVAAREALAFGDSQGLGRLLTRNHELLVEIGVSSAELNTLVAAALAAGALGAKLSGAGWGGVMLALVHETRLQTVSEALLAAGATQVLSTAVEVSKSHT